MIAILFRLVPAAALFAVLACSRPVTATQEPQGALSQELRQDAHDSEDGIPDVDDRCPVFVGCYEDEWMDMDGCPDVSVAFDEASSHLNEDARRTLDMIATEVTRLGARLGALRITSGRNPGERPELAMERIRAVRAYLATSGVSDELMRIREERGIEPPGPYVGFEVEQCETTTPRADWWTGFGACPDGARPVGFDRVQVYCETADGTRHGRVNWWHGHERFYEGTFVRDRRHGTWVVWQRGERIATAHYDEQGRLAPGAALWTPEQVQDACAGQPSGPDCDHDSVPAARDLCLTLPEDLDGFIDDDGCPEPDIDDGCPVESAPCTAGGG